MENRDTGNFGNGFLEQLEPFAGQFRVEDGKSGDVAARTGKAFNMACFDRVEPAAGHDDGNRLGGLSSRRNPRVSARDYDHIDFKPRQYGGKTLMQRSGFPSE